MERKNIDKIKTMDLFELFKEEMIEKTQEAFNISDDLRPIIFLGVRKNAMLDQINKEPSLNEQYKQYIDAADGDEDLIMDKSIHCAMIPLGQFFEDTGIPELNNITKMMARNMIDKIVTDMRKVDINSVMFSAFISEAWMGEHVMTDKEKRAAQLGKEMPGPIQEHINKGKRVKDFPGAKEKVVLCFETRMGSQICTFDIDRSDPIQKKAVNFKEHAWSSNQSEGLFSGIVHTPDSPNLN